MSGTYLVIGATGAQGGAVAERLEHGGHTVRGFSRRHGDLADPEAVRAAFEGPLLGPAAAHVADTYRWISAPENARLYDGDPGKVEAAFGVELTPLRTWIARTWLARTWTAR